MRYRKDIDMAPTEIPETTEMRPLNTNHETKAIRRALNAAALALTALSLLGATVVSATPKHEAEHLSWEQGLSQTTVFSIYHDREGAVWFGTEDGLNRFDGQSFRVYRYDPKDPTSLPGNTVRSLTEGSDGRIWIATEGGGVAAWDPLTDAFTSYRRDPLKGVVGLASNYTRSVLFDETGYVWVATRDAGLDRLDPLTGVVTNFRHDSHDASSLASDRVYSLLQTDDGRLFVGTNEGLDLYDAASQSFAHVELGDTAKNTRVRALLEDSKETLWVGTKGSGLFGFDLVDNSVQQYRHGDSDTEADSDRSLSSNNIQTLLEDGFGQLWVGTADGLNLMDRLTGEFEHYGSVDISATGGSGSVTSLHADGTGALWVGTELGGLIRWEGPKGHFKDSHAEINDIVTSFTQDGKGALYFGTVGKGLARVSKHGRIAYLKNDPDDPYTLSDDRVMSLFTDSKGRVWVGTMQGGLNKLNPSKRIFQSYRNDPDDPNSLSADGVMTIHEDAQGNLWVGTFGGGLNAFDPKTKKFTAFRHDPNEPTSLGSDRVTTVLGTDSGLLWVGTDGGGLNLFDPATGTARRFEHDPLNPTSLPADTVCSLFVDRFGTLWVGTRGGGLAKMIGEPSELTDPVFVSYTEADGLPNSVVYAIQPDFDGSLWLSTNHGLSRFDPSALTFTNFDVNDGLQANEFNFGASYRTVSGELYFGGINGYNALAPAEAAHPSGNPRSEVRSERKAKRALQATSELASGSVAAGF